MELERYKEAYRSIAKEEERHGFIAHLIGYIFVNVLMILCDIFLTKGPLWFYFPLIFWGIGLLQHYLYSVYWIERELKKRELFAEEMSKKRG